MVEAEDEDAEETEACTMSYIHHLTLPTGTRWPRTCSDDTLLISFVSATLQCTGQHQAPTNWPGGQVGGDPAVPTSPDSQL